MAQSEVCLEGIKDETSDTKENNLITENRSKNSETIKNSISTWQPLDFEKKPSYTLKVEGANINVDPSLRYRGPFKDVTIVHVSVEDVDEPPVFDLPVYYIELPEDAEIGTMLKTVSARDPDAANNTVRWGGWHGADLVCVFFNLTFSFEPLWTHLASLQRYQDESSKSNVQGFQQKSCLARGKWEVRERLCLSDENVSSINVCLPWVSLEQNC